MNHKEAEQFFGKWGKVIDFNILDKCLSALSEKMQVSQTCPNPKNLFEAFSKCNYDDLKVVMLGEDPYPQKGVATGVAFANSVDTPKDKWSPSLKILFDACVKSTDDLPRDEKVFPSLLDWEKQGVLMLNSALSVEENNPGSHTLLWRKFITDFIEKLSSEKQDVIWCLLGEVAHSYESHILSNLVVISRHPAFYARQNCEMPPDIFKVINETLVNKLHKTPILWL